MSAGLKVATSGSAVFEHIMAMQTDIPRIIINANEETVTLPYDVSMSTDAFYKYTSDMTSTPAIKSNISKSLDFESQSDPVKKMISLFMGVWDGAKSLSHDDMAHAAKMKITEDIKQDIIVDMAKRALFA